MQKGQQKKKLRPGQSQSRPGREKLLKPLPVFDHPERAGTGKLKGRTALITGGDSGIGKAVAVLFAKEGADIAIAYLNEQEDARETADYIFSHYNKKCLLIKGDLGREKHCIQVIKKTIGHFGKLDILVNNAALHFENNDLRELSNEELLISFSVNIFSFFWLTREALPYLKKGASIINTSSVTAYRGSASLIDYASTKGAIISFTRSLASNLIKKGIRVNAVAPGPVWTPLIASSFDKDKVAEHGSDSPMGRAADPVEIAPSYLFLASEDGSYFSGQVLHPNGGEIVNG